MTPRWPILTLFSLSACVVVAWLMGFRVNTTDSMPLGLYRLIDGPVQRGDMVVLCTPAFWGELGRDRGYTGEGSCPDGSKHLLKILAGVEGDSVQVTAEGIEVAGRLQLASLRRLQDRSDRPVPSVLVSGAIPQGKALVLAPVSWSFDGRYFGYVPLVSLRKVYPILIEPLGARNERNDEIRNHGD